MYLQGPLGKRRTGLFRSTRAGASMCVGAGPGGGASPVGGVRGSRSGQNQPIRMRKISAAAIGKAIGWKISPVSPPPTTSASIVG